MKDFGTSKSTKIDSIFDSLLVPRPSRSLTLRDDFASSSPLRCQLPNDWTSRSDAIFGSPLAPTARRVSSIASRLPGTTSLRFAFPGWQRRYWGGGKPQCRVPNLLDPGFGGSSVALVTTAYTQARQLMPGSLTPAPLGLHLGGILFARRR
ncbi:MAG: hypothetical protein ABW068_16135 [Candidatus Thiodiazotropha sp.]